MSPNLDPTIPKNNFPSFFLEPDIFDWLCKQVIDFGFRATEYLSTLYEPEVDLGGGVITLIGNSPWNQDDFIKLLENHGIILNYVLREGEWLSNTNECTIIVGHIGWTPQLLDAHINQISTGECYIYSQEMVLAYILCQTDPLLDAPIEILHAFAKGHSALEYLLNEYVEAQFNWPSPIVSSTGQGFQQELKGKGMMGAMGYSVAKNYSREYRRQKLQEIYTANPSQMPLIDNKDSQRKWHNSKAKSSRRLQLMAQYIAHFLCRIHQHNKQAVSKYLEDLNWLKEKYYYPKRNRFQWPDPHVK
jgi:hypothetical protein